MSKKKIARAIIKAGECRDVCIYCENCPLKRSECGDLGEEVAAAKKWLRKNWWRRV